MPRPRRRVLLQHLAVAAMALARPVQSAPQAGASPAVHAGRGELVLWTMQLSPFHDAYMHGVLRGFEAAHPGWRVKWVDVPWAEMERKMLASLAAGTAPDVVNLNPQFSARLAELGALADPRRHLEPEAIAAYLPPAWAANQLGGVPFALPWYLSTTVTLAHRGLLDAAGVAEVPRSYDALRQAARALRELGGTGAEASSRYAWFPAMDGAAPLETLVAMGGMLLAPDACRPGFEGAPGAAVFGYHRELFERRWVPPTVLTEGHRAAVAQFLAGQVAMVPTGMQFLAQVKKNNPPLYAQIRVAPQLSGLSAARPSSGGHPAGGPMPGPAAARPNIAAMNLAVPQAGRRLAAAFALARHVSNPANQLELCRRVPLLPSTRSSYDDALFHTSSGDPLLDEARRLSVQQVFDGAVAVPPVRRYHKLRTSYVRSLMQCMAGRTSPEQAVAEVVRAWVPLLHCAEGRA